MDIPFFRQIQIKSGSMNIVYVPANVISQSLVQFTHSDTFGSRNTVKTGCYSDCPHEGAINLGQTYKVYTWYNNYESKREDSCVIHWTVDVALMHVHDIMWNGKHFQNLFWCIIGN